MRSVRFVLSLAVVMTSDLAAPGRLAAAGPEEVGKWSAPRDLGIVGTQAALLRSGRVLFYSGIEGESEGSVARLYNPVTNKIKNVNMSFAHEAFCSGVSAMPDGRILVVGGQRGLGFGIRDVSIFDPATQTWAEGASLGRARYYPSVVAMPDGRTLAIAGSNENGGDVKELEVYDPEANSWAAMPNSANQTSSTYPDLVLLPDGRVLRVADQPMTRALDPVTSSWSNVAEMNYGSRAQGGTVLLPGLERVLISGGADGLNSTATAEILDMSVSSPTWTYTGAMRKARSNHNLLLLADGTVLAVGGGLVQPYGTAVKEAELYNPATGEWKLMAAQQVQRTYHSTALLLPDGRVISAGSDFGFGSETYEIYSPPYLFHGPRPRISSVPTSLTYGQPFTVTTAEAADISRVALVRPGTTTHANHFDQRYVDLAFSPGIGGIDVTAPASAGEAPPGYYMLFILSSGGVPSIAPFVHLA